jgi:hypothetical protein
VVRQAKHTEAYVARGAAYANQGMLKQAIREFGEQQQRRHPSKAQTLLARAALFD